MKLDYVAVLQHKLKIVRSAGLLTYWNISYMKFNNIPIR